MSGPTTEHFPELNDWKILQREGEYVLEDKSKDGTVSVFTDLIFHGGPGQTIELRVFSINALRENFEKAGFHKIEVLETNVPEFGLFYPEKWSLTWIVST